MAFIQFNNVFKSFLDKEILNNISFSIENKDKIGLIGQNGTGKSTIINIILGKENISSGNIFVDKNIQIGYISQNHNFEDTQNTIFEELNSVFKKEHEIFEEIQILNFKLEKDPSIKEKLNKLYNEFNAKDGYNIDYKINQVINGLNLFDLKDNIIKTLSGGEKTRVCIAKLLLQEPDILILDEPTNHLDIASIEWLEEFLKKYNKTFLLVSHDRIFLDNVCNKIFELENRKLRTYKGNFSSFVIQKEMILKGELKEYEKEQDRIKKLNEYIERNRAGRMASQAKGRQKLLSRLIVHENPNFNPNTIKLKFTIKNATSENVLELNNINKSFDDKIILNNINLKVYKGERIGIIGKNGGGKSTILKIAAKKLKEDSGTVKLADNATIGYFDQNIDNLNRDNTILQEINTKLSYTNEDLRSMAASFLFKDDDVEKKIDSLSGGEKVRVSFIKLMQREANFLILDEPTNHLDIYSIEILERALEDFEGTILLVSHNRHFLDKICNTIYILDEKGLKKFKGNYEEYKNSLKEKEKIAKDISKKEEYLLQKEKNKKINKIKKDIEIIEARLERIDVERNNYNQQMFVPSISSNIEKLLEIQNKLENLDREEENLMNSWQDYETNLKEMEDEF